jgi:AraC family transcriptional regulator
LHYLAKVCVFKRPGDVEYTVTKPMNRCMPIVETPLVKLARFDHPEHVCHRDPRQERSPEYSANFLQSGAYTLTSGKMAWRLSARSVFLGRPGLVYSCRHDEECPNDVTLTLEFGKEFSDELAKTVQAAAGGLPAVRQEDNHLAYLHWRLRRASEDGAEPLDIEAVAAEVFSAAFCDAWRPEKLFRPVLLDWYARRVEGARELMESDYAQPHSLNSLSRLAGMSPFHFSRVFRELVGTPPHQYLLAVRLRRAAERIRQGSSVTEACYASGFANLSHFIRLFRRKYGDSPSKWASA